MERGTALPQCFRQENELDRSAWMQVKTTLNAHEWENALAATGWTFQYMAGEGRATAFGFDREKMLHAALKRLIAGARLQKCNCLQIDDVSMHAFLGMPYVSVTAHSRNMQKGSLFCGN